MVVGPALHAFGWQDGDLDAIAGAVVAGHVIECGAQCCGGNYAFFEEIPHRERIGFPIAEMDADGSSVITKHPGSGGAVTVGTVTAQLLYEIGGPRYLSPDAVARFDTIALTQEGPDRVRIAGVRGEAPPASLKVTANLHGGWRNAMTLAITGAQVEQKADMAAAAVWAGIPGGQEAYAETAQDLSGDLSGGGMAYLRLAVRGDDELAVGRAFSGAVIETSLSSYPGTFFTSAPSGAQGVARYWPTTVSVSAVQPQVECEGNQVATTMPAVPPRRPRPGPEAEQDVAPSARRAVPRADLVRVPLHVLIGARSGDKGGAANLGLWADTDVVAGWLLEELTVDALKAFLPEVAAFEIERHPLANLRAVNFVVHGILGWGVASNLRLDTQAKGLGELLRSRAVEVPSLLVSAGPAGRRWAALDHHWRFVETVRFIAFVVGIALVLVTVWSVFTALVVPRVTSSRVQRGVARILGGGARRISPKLPSYEVRDRLLSFVGPAAMVLLFAIWLCLLVLGFGCIIWWDAGTDFATRSGSPDHRSSPWASPPPTSPGPRHSRSCPPASACSSLRSRSPTCRRSTVRSPPGRRR